MNNDDLNLHLPDQMSGWRRFCIFYCILSVFITCPRNHLQTLLIVNGVDGLETY